MCVYCTTGDHVFRYDPPWEIHPDEPYIPKPLVPTINDWNLSRLREYLDLLKQIKELEDKVGCPCEPAKADYIRLFEERIKKLEKASGS